MESYYPAEFLTAWRERLGLGPNGSGTGPGSGTGTGSFVDALDSPAAARLGHRLSRGHSLSSTDFSQVHIARFANGLEWWNVYLRDPDPQIHRHEEAACVDVAALVLHPLLNLRKAHHASVKDINSFDAVVCNQFLDGKKVAAKLHTHGYTGQLVLIPKFSCGHIAYRDAIEALFNPKHATLRAHAGAASKSWYGVTTHSLLQPLLRLVVSRAADAKASMYPLSYTAPNGTDVVCKASLQHGDFKDCLGHPWHACRAEECARESHFCMPGACPHAACVGAHLRVPLELFGVY
jgi:hypothetical protein